VTNVGGPFQGGEVFHLFNHPVTFSTVTLPTVSPPLYLTNRLAIDGTITIGGVSPIPPTITFSSTGTSMSVSWPPNHLGWTLQTNAVSLTATNQWFPYPNSQTVTNVTIPIQKNKSPVFLRLVLTLP
jgi:hypothetical protein